MTMLVDDKSWVARQLSLGKHVAWIEQQRQIPRAEILALGEQLGMHLDEAADVMTVRPKALDVDPNAAPVHPEGYTNPTTVPARLTSPTASAVDAGAEIDRLYPPVANDVEFDDDPRNTEPWTCPSCTKVEPLGERYHFEHDAHADPADTRNVGIIGHPSSGVTTVADAAANDADVFGDGPYCPVSDEPDIPAVAASRPSTLEEQLVRPPQGDRNSTVEEPAPLVRGPLSERARQIARDIGAHVDKISDAEAVLADAQADIDRLKAIEEDLCQQLITEMSARPSVFAHVARNYIDDKPPTTPGYARTAEALAQRNRAANERIARLGGRPAIRNWANANGYTVGNVGAIAVAVLDAYEAAHPQQEAANA